VNVRFAHVLGAEGYRIYLAEQPGVTPQNYAAFPGGRRVDVSGSPASVCCSTTPSVLAGVTAVAGVSTVRRRRKSL